MNRAVLPGEKGDVRLTDAPSPPAPRNDEVLVRMLYAPVNPADLLAIEGRYSFDLPHDQPLGAEGAGLVEAVGEAVDDLRPGELVMPLERGNWCARRLLPRRHLMALPGVDPVQAAMLRINPPTAHLLLRHAGVRPGEALIQNGAGSVVAHWVRAFAARMDVKVINVVRRLHPETPDALLDGDDLAERAQAASGGRPIRTALDCVAGAATGRLASCLARGGRLLLFGHLSGEPIQVRSQLLTGGGLSIAGFSLRPAEAALGAVGVHAMFRELAAFHASDPPALPVREIVPLSRAVEGIVLARAGGSGRILFDLTR